MFEFFGKKISGRFTIPSGIVTTNPQLLQWVANNIPEVGILTTKSIGPKPRAGNKEPIYVETGKDSYMNAVGLTNPGVEVFAEQIDKLNLPEDKFLLCSILGGDLEEFVFTAKKIVDKVDGFELNVSCPHAEGHGQSIGENCDLVVNIIKEVKKLGKPVLVKISPNIPGIAQTIKMYQEAGADGFVAINTLGPGLFTLDGQPVLKNKVGGMSGKSVFPMALKVVKEITEATDLPVLACGGIISGGDAREFVNMGVEFLGVGSAVTGMDSKEIVQYFARMEKDVQNKTDEAEKLIKKEKRMKYKKFVIAEKEDLSDDLTHIKLDGDVDAGFGQFAFMWLPGIGEKPFSVYYDKPLSFLIQKFGYFSGIVQDLKVGDEVYVRGPYGKIPELSGKVLVVGGGCGIASFKVLTDRKDLECKYLFGNRCAGRIPDRELFEKDGLIVTTDDGSEGYKGFVTDVLEDAIKEFKPDFCVNCGPEPMLKRVEEMQLKHIPRENIFSSYEKLTMCGVGICGKCVREDGLRTCVDGPFLLPVEKDILK